MGATPEPRKRSGARAALAVVLILILVLCLILACMFWPFADTDGDGLPDWYEEAAGTIETPAWTLDMTQVSDLQAAGMDGAGVVIGIVDTGIDASHPEFADDPVIAWKDFVNGEAEPYDDGGHGTAMASIIVGSDRLTGVAPMAKLMVAKAIPGDGGGDDAIVGAAISWCVDPNGDVDVSDGADIISLSLGGGEHPRFGSAAGAAAAEAASKGILVVASAGNDGEQDDGDVESPSSEELVIAVGAIDSSGTIASFSSVGDNDGRTPQAWDDRQDPNRKPECVAPGVGIVTAFPDGLYATVSGTSPAAAYASGILALVLDAHPELMGTGGSAAVLEVKQAIMDTSEKLGSQEVPHDDHYGYGLLQAADLSGTL